MLSLVLVSLGVAASLIAVSLALWRGARWTGMPRGFMRVLLAVGLTTAGVAALHGLMVFYRDDVLEHLLDQLNLSHGAAILFGCELLLGLLAALLILKATLRAPLAAVCMAAVPALILVVVSIALVPLVVEPFVLEPVRLYSGSMCPTLLGRSQTATCPQCGGTAYTPWITERVPPDANGRLCMCSACWHTERLPLESLEILPPDAFVVNKLLKPRRWDLVLFRATHINNPSHQAAKIRYVKRVVGLPGEEVVIQDGAIWINGDRQTPPMALDGLKFQDKDELILPIRWGRADKPARLGDDEYFVMGDYGYHSNDSRMWLNAIKGYSPYGLPASYIEGVVDLRYSPLARWQVFR